MKCYTDLIGKGKHEAFFENSRGTRWEEAEAACFVCMSVLEWGLRSEGPHPIHTPFSAWNVPVKEPGGGVWVAAQNWGTSGRSPEFEGVGESIRDKAVELYESQIWNYSQKRLGLPWRKWEDFEVR